MLRSNSKSLGNHVVSPEEEKERQKKTISLRAHWYRRTQKRALRQHGELYSGLQLNSPDVKYSTIL